jgi:1-acyl-sn-glycerol-3-phosphate acyltransferase
VIRSLLSTISFVVATILGSLTALVFGAIDRSGDLVFALARLWSRVILGVPGVKLDIRMRVPLEPGRPYVFMPNHASMIDIWAVFVAIPASFRFIAKKQLARIPLFGWAMAAGRFIFIDRQNTASARRSMSEAARRIRLGQSVVIFAEGTRTRDGRLLPFKKGGFHLAMESGVPIVPVAIKGSRELMPRGAALIRAGTVTVEFSEPIPTEGLKNGQRDALIAKVRGRVAEMLGEPIEAAAPDPQ